MGDEASKKDSVAKTDGSRLRRRLRRVLWRVKWRLTSRRSRKRSEAHVRELSDDDDNERTHLPEGEILDWAGLWLAEVYGPSHVPRLREGLEGLELEKSGGFLRGHDAVESVLAHRGGAGGWTNLGFFAQPGTFIGVDPPRGLPEDFVFTQPTFFGVAPGVTVLIIQFALAESRRQELAEILRQDFHAEARPLKHHAGHSMHHASDLKEERIGDVREQVRTSAAGWLAEHLPGAYTTGLDTTYPSWDLLLTGDSQLFREEMSGPDDWRDSVGFGRVRERWAADKFDGLFLIEPFGLVERTRAVSSFVGRRAPLIEGLGAGHEKDVHSLLQALHSAVGGLLSAWAYSQVLRAHEHQFSNIRDQLAAPATGPFRTGRRLRRLQREVLPLAFDLETLERGSQDEWSLKLLARYRETDFAGVSVKTGHGKELPPLGDDLLTLLRNHIEEEGRKVAESGKAISAAIRTQAEILLAATNVRLQWMVAGLTILVGAAGVYATVQAS